ncbi:TPA: Panacea domain-containing protein, partial [Streptococcus pyogenes]
QAWHLALTAENSSDDELNSAKLFNSNFEAWVHGPVIPEVYDMFKANRGSVIKESGITGVIPSNILNQDELANIDDVISTYGIFNGSELESLSHNEDPWKEARIGLEPLESSQKVISYKTMYEYYSARLV